MFSLKATVNQHYIYKDSVCTSQKTSHPLERPSRYCVQCTDLHVICGLPEDGCVVAESTAIKQRVARTGPLFCVNNDC
jgi:hypothetical protein